MKLLQTITLNSDGEIELGIFTYLFNNYSNELTFLQDVDVNTLNTYYYLGRSGKKTISILFDNLLKQYNDKTIVINLLSRIIYNKYNINWNKIYSSFTEDYNPLHNYNMKDEETTSVDESDHSTSKQTESENVVNLNKRWGFNSATSVPESESTQTRSPEDNVQEEINNSTKESTVTRTNNRSGNIGVTTTQKLLQEELEVRKYNFLTNVMQDIDKILCSKIYDIKGEF